MNEIYSVKDLLLSNLIKMSIWVNDLVSQTSAWEIRSLRNIEDLIDGWLVNHSSKHGPKLAQNTEERTLTATVGTCYHQVHARLDLETHLLDQSISIR